MKAWLIPVLLALASVVVEGQSLEKLEATASVVSQVDSLIPDGELGAFCATVWDRPVGLATVRVAAIRQLPGVWVAPQCNNMELPILVRPQCVFSVGEYVAWRPTGLYVILVCRPNAVGVDLKTKGAAT